MVIWLVCSWASEGVTGTASQIKVTTKPVIVTPYRIYLLPSVLMTFRRHSGRVVNAARACRAQLLLRSQHRLVFHAGRSLRRCEIATAPHDSGNSRPRPRAGFVAQSGPI